MSCPVTWFGIREFSLGFYLFSCGLFNNTVNNSDCIPSNDRTIGGLESMRSWPSCRYYPKIRTDGRKTKKLAGLGAEILTLDLHTHSSGLVSPGGSTERSMK